ncbi:hypothetical protein FMM05_06195 [Flavobacterium zepuense]|uniref:Lipoprotein n=1 Tax=Flavobacterium zepuense TaxID=2593302 RepID=A0A552V5T9_9FLAO|nr:DUF6146 family protein [Flavobacterium zepuense]TRW25811.1 hypothetical protein FMM05_06195 [Flavobacterium zepuense]
MKSYMLTIAAIIGLASVVGCKTNENANTTITAIPQNEVTTVPTASDTVRIANDSLEYEVIIIDGGFTSWLASRAQARGYYGEPYLRTKNTIWTTEWNARVLNSQRYGDLYQMRIDYDPKIEYGYEVNYLIYNYLVYFQQTNNQRLGGIVPQN